MGTRRNDTLEQGSQGGNLINDTTATTGNFGGLLVLEDAVINSITGDGTIANLSDMEDSSTLAAGLYIPMKFSAITLTSGTVIAYTDYE